MASANAFPLIRTGWYVAAPSSRLRTEPLACRVLDHDIVLFRDAAGAAHALLDRCCHRGVRLSLGTISDGVIACHYHGWRYDGGGRCVCIPSLTQGAEPPSRARVRAFTCLEQDAYVWVWTGDGEPVPNAPTRIDSFEEFLWQQGSIEMACAAGLGLENNLDWCHPAFAHPWAHGQFFHSRLAGAQEHAYEARVTDDGMVLFGPATDSQNDPIPAQCRFKARFAIPDRLTLEVGHGSRSIIVLHCVPTGEETSRLEWLTSVMPSTRPIDGTRVSWSAEEPLIFMQDRLLLESAQAAYRREGARFECSVQADTSTLLARRIIALASEGRWPGARATLPPRRVVSVKV